MQFYEVARIIVPTTMTDMSRFSRHLSSVVAVVVVTHLLIALGLTSTVRAATSCAQGGACVVGSIGPGGGIVVYDAGSLRWWGRYLEARPLKYGRGLVWSGIPTESLYKNDAIGVAKRQRINAKQIGMGLTNSRLIVEQSNGAPSAAGYILNRVIGGESDWYLPSKDELNVVYNLRAVRKIPQMDTGPYWTSTEAAVTYAWYQLFQDGTQYTEDSNIGKVDGNKGLTKNMRHAFSGFPSTPFRLVAMRAFPQGTGLPEAPYSASLTGNTCSDSGPCVVGDLGPGGGIVFYDAGVHKTWGRYLEAAPESTDIAGLRWKNIKVSYRARPIYKNTKLLSAQVQRVMSKSIGMGAKNTRTIVKTYGIARYAARYSQDLVVNGVSDWFLPSADELDVMFNVLYANTSVLGGLRKGFYWTSSEYDYNNAWTQTFGSGQQFDREKPFIRGEETGGRSLRVRAIRAFG